MSSFLDKAVHWIFGADPKSDPEYPSEQDQVTAYLRTMVLASLADGVRKDEEAVAGHLGARSIPALAALPPDALAERIAEVTADLGAHAASFPLESLGEMLPTAESRARAFGLALVVIYADHELLPSEQAFLEDLREALHLSPGEAQTLQSQVRARVGQRR
jgi:uncharacterized membrane protein YebE (DUF533 family)